MNNKEEHFHSPDSCEVEAESQYPSENPVPREISAGKTIDGRRCITHNILICRCGWEWNWHVVFQNNILENIKDRCFLCKAKFFKLRTIAEYRKKGNACQVCINRCGAIVTVTGKTAKYPGVKITISQADHLLLARKKIVGKIITAKELDKRNKVDNAAFEEVVGKNQIKQLIKLKK